MTPLAGTWPAGTTLPGTTLAGSGTWLAGTTLGATASPRPAWLTAMALPPGLALRRPPTTGLDAAAFGAGRPRLDASSRALVVRRSAPIALAAARLVAFGTWVADPAAT